MNHCTTAAERSKYDTSPGNVEIMTTANHTLGRNPPGELL